MPVRTFGPVEGRVVEVLRAAEEWLTTAHVARRAGVKHRQARYHLARLVASGVVEHRQVPAHRSSICDHFVDVYRSREMS